MIQKFSSPSSGQFPFLLVKFPESIDRKYAQNTSLPESESAQEKRSTYREVWHIALQARTLGLQIQNAKIPPSVVLSWPEAVVKICHSHHTVLHKADDIHDEPSILGRHCCFGCCIYLCQCWLILPTRLLVNYQSF